MTGDTAALLQSIVIGAVPVAALPWRAASTMLRLLRARRPQLLPLVLRRKEPFGEEDLERVVRRLVAVLHLAHVREAGQAMCSLAGLTCRSRACWSASFATSTRPAAQRRPTCLHGQLGPSQQHSECRVRMTSRFCGRTAENELNPGPNAIRSLGW